MRIFNWVYKRFPHSPHHYSSKEAFDDPWEMSQASRLSCKARSLDAKAGADTEALLHHPEYKKDKAENMMLNNSWPDFHEISGLLAIGTLGLEPGNSYGGSVLDDEENLKILESADEDLIDPIEVEVFEEKLEEVFGSSAIMATKNKDGSPNMKLEEGSNEQQISSCRNSNVKNMYPLHEFFEVFPLAENATSNTTTYNNNNNNKTRTTLADLFAKSKGHEINSDKELTKEQLEIEATENKKRHSFTKKHKLSRSGRALFSKIVNWKEGGPVKAKRWMKKMLYRKIHPEEAEPVRAAGDAANERIDVTKTYVNASKLKQIHQESQGGSATPRIFADSELISLLEKGGTTTQECWIKTDSEYVVLEL